MTHSSNSTLRRNILEAARHLLQKDGYRNLSMRKIARQLDCSQGTIYLYFKNKDAIFYALIDEGTNELYEIYRKTLAQTVEPVEQLEAICRAYIEFGLNNSGYYEAMFILTPMLEARIPVEQYRRARRFLELTADTLLSCTQQQAITLADPFLEATILWSGLHGLVSLILTQRVDVRLNQDTLIDTTVQRIVEPYRHLEEMRGLQGR